VEVRLLGPVDVLAAGGPRAVDGRRRRAVLAVLALHDGQIASTGTLLEAVWGRAAPAVAVNTLQSHMSYLRTVLGSKTAILARPPGYVLHLEGDGTDVRAAERLLREGTQAADPGQEMRLLREALALWRGRPLADVAGSAWLEGQAARLDLLQVQVERALAEARLAAGEHAQLAFDLAQLAGEHPLDEQIHAQLMLALYRSGRQADALAVYHRLRRTLAQELGIDPSQNLRELEAAILRQDQVLGAPTLAVTVPLSSPAVAMPADSPAPQASPVVPVPAQLPPALAAFAGRKAELASLDALLPHAAEAGRGMVVISAVSGTAGVGKTTLAVKWAHQIAERFPDGQLYVNLRGFGPDGTPVDPAEAMRGFLDALGAPAARIPAGLAGQTALYRSLLRGKRVLVVLDNARDAAQARPLLPGTPGCLAIVTSRNQLIGLAAAEGAAPLALDLPTSADAHDLLERRLGEVRLASDPAAADEIIQRCARLPLALAIVAARAAIRPSLRLAGIAAELREANAVLDPLEGDELASDVRAIFSWSYHALPADAAWLFRLLGLQPGPDIAIAAAASLAAIPRQQARPLLAGLARAHLLAEYTPGRYGFHDLLRAYAGELAHTHDSPSARHAAIGRLLDHYLHTAHHAAMLIEPYYDPLALAPAEPGVVRDQLTTAAEALSWFDTEHGVVLAAVQLAADAGFSARAWQLVWSLSDFLLRGGLWHEQARICGTGLKAARDAGDITGQAHCLHRLAVGYTRSGRLHDAGPLLEQALRLFETMGDQFGQAYVHGMLGLLANRQQHTAAALGHFVRALDLYRAADHPGQVMVLNDIGYTHALLGDYPQALDFCEQALAVIRELGASNWENAVWDSLGYVHHQLGDHQQAITCYQRSLDLSGELADRWNEAATLDHLGDTYHSLGDTAAAHRAWTQALRIFGEIDHPDGDRLRAKLHSHRASYPAALHSQHRD
jgi:DNA-binding SARP family transcriptional activator